MIEKKIHINKIASDLYFPINNKGIFLIFCQGIPGREKYSEFARKFTSKGFIFIHPKYRGSYGSKGKFTIKGCKKTIIDFTKRIIKEGFILNSKKIRPKKIFLIGHSFGGSIALVVSSEIKIDGVIALAPIVDYRQHNTNKKRKEEEVRGLYQYINSQLKDSFRGLKKNDWDKFVKTGSELNPIDYINKLQNKKIFLAHGKKDNSVDYLKTKKFFLLLKGKNNELFLSSKSGHSNIREESSEKIINWIEKISKIF